MSLKTQYENADIDNENIVPLGSEQIKSFLKTQSEAVFQDKNISNNSNFIKKSLIDLALDFETKQEKNNITNEHESVSPDEVNTKETKPEETEVIDKTDQNENTESNNEPKAVVENIDKQNLLSDENIENNEDLTKVIYLKMLYLKIFQISKQLMKINLMKNKTKSTWVKMIFKKMILK
jgi:hypothetical protein